MRAFQRMENALDAEMNYGLLFVLNNVYGNIITRWYKTYNRRCCCYFLLLLLLLVHLAPALLILFRCL